MNKVKELLAWFKHITKDPIKTIPEADARKKEIMPLLYVSIGLAAIPIVLVAIFVLLIDLDLSPYISWISFIGFVGIAFCAFLLFVISKAKAKFAALTCDDCNTMLDIQTIEDYNKYVTYEVVSENTDSKLSHPASNNGVVSSINANGSSTAILNVSFRCPSCGKTKSFQYTITPFKCSMVEKNVRVADVETVKTRMINAINPLIEIYKSGDRSSIPFTIHSVHHPNYENRTKPQTGNSYPHINGVKIDYHRTIEEMVEGFFIHNELNGNIKCSK